MRIVVAALTLTATATLTGCGSFSRTAPTEDCGTMIRYEHTVYWSTGRFVDSAGHLGEAEEPECGDVGGTAGPMPGALREGLWVGSLSGIDEQRALVLIPEPSAERGELFVSGSGPTALIPRDVRRALR